MKDLYILNYNNYYNRILKKENSLSAYLSAARDYRVLENANFNKRDGINTQHVINFAIGESMIDGDYLIVVEDGEIISRWFIMENLWNREKQIILTLRRDLLVDYYNEYKNVPFFCEKGMIPASDNMIFNSENMTYNQIKASEIQLPDETNTRWVILYVARNFQVDDEDTSFRLAMNKVIKFRNTRASFALGGTYEVWCFPYDDVKFKLQDGTIITCRNASETTQGALANLPLHIGDAFIYDYQLMPYCPFIGSRGWRVQEDNASVKTIICPENDNDFEVATTTSGAVIQNDGLVLVYSASAYSSFSFAPNYPYATGSAIDCKVDSECRFVRVCDTLESSVFEFNVAKNGGAFEFEVFVRYKPYAPSIRIKPVFNRLYGINRMDDQRGVNTTVSYSLPQISSAWREYQIQNANYNNIFNRGIQNQETNRDIQMKQMKMAGVLNAISAGINTGSSSGLLSNSAGINPIGSTAIGIGTGITATALSLAGAAEDIAAFKGMADENIDYAKDLFGYQMGNIQALPTNLVSAGVFGAYPRKFPFIEIYTASSVEIQALKDKIKYNGFSIGRIGTFTEFENNANSITGTKYIKGKIIRCEDIDEDFHLLAELGYELNKGVFTI